MIDYLLHTTGLEYLSQTNLIILAIFLGIGCTLMGFFTDSMLRSSGFGPVGNGLLLLIGFAGTVIVYNHYIRQVRTENPFVVMGVAVGGALAFLIAMAFVRLAIDGRN